MKKVLSIIAAVLILALSVVPAFAAEDTVRSPHGDTHYVVNIHPTQGGTGDWYYTSKSETSKVADVHVYAIPNEGYTFDHWELKGDYTANGNYSYIQGAAKFSVPFLAKTDANGNDDTVGELDLTLNSDVEATPYFKKTGTEEVPTGTPKSDDSSKSPQTGTDTTMLYVVVGITLLIAAAGAVTATAVIKKRK